MLAELATKPNAALVILLFVTFGVLASSLYVWHLWRTLWEKTCCGKIPIKCTCAAEALAAARERYASSTCTSCGLMSGKHQPDCQWSKPPPPDDA